MPRDNLPSSQCNDHSCPLYSPGSLSVDSRQRPYSKGAGNPGTTIRGLSRKSPATRCEKQRQVWRDFLRTALVCDDVTYEHEVHGVSGAPGRSLSLTYGAMQLKPSHLNDLGNW